jgi:hypothetical protein
LAIFDVFTPWLVTLYFTDTYGSNILLTSIFSASMLGGSRIQEDSLHIRGSLALRSAFWLAYRIAIYLLLSALLA